jgi:hypothetical protein
MFRIVKVPLYIPVIVPKKTTKSSPQAPPPKRKALRKSPTALYETLDEFNDIWSDLKRM